MKQKGAAPIFVLVGILVIAVGVYYFSTQKGQQVFHQQQEKLEQFDVLVKENPTDKNKSDVYLKGKSGKEAFFITLDEVLRNHIHNSEYHNGNLYIIRRTGGEEGYQDIPDWTDELWKYDSNKKGIKLYSIRGLDFRVSNDDKLIAIIGAESNELDILIFIDTNGKHLSEFGGDDLGIHLMQPLVWGKNTFWVVDLPPPYPEALIRIDINPFQASKYEVGSVGIGMEYVVNPDTGKVAYSDYPPLFDEDSAKEYEKSDKKVTLTVYDLVSEKKEEIATSITKHFNPKWINDNTLEYDNPTGEGRITKKI